MKSSALFLCFFLLSCTAVGTPDPDLFLENGVGKADQAEVIVSLNDAQPITRFGVRCDGEAGCTGSVTAELLSPNACDLLDEGACDPDNISQPFLIGTLTLSTSEEGERAFPLTLSANDGIVTSVLSLPFEQSSGLTMFAVFEKAEGVPPIELSLRANWEDREVGGTGELELFLSSIEGLAFEEIPTQFSPYRAYLLLFEQPIDHEDPTAGTFLQRAVLHHRDQAAPVVLHTSGYDLFAQDHLAELTQPMGANQLDTEQRYFGESVPAGLAENPDELWHHVTIRNAAGDHHRFIDALNDFYDGSWLSTGHSKGGMTSVYHHRFYPDDVAATVAYVAPISFSRNDPQYQPFLATIGDAECRESIRGMVRAMLERFDEYQPTVFASAFPADADAEAHATYFEATIELYEWGFWQGQGIEACPGFTGAEEFVRSAATDELAGVATQLFGFGATSSLPGDAYAFQANLQLGSQSFFVEPFSDVAPRPNPDMLLPPAGTHPEHAPDAMLDVQQWVRAEAENIVFLYGEYDPWTGGAFDITGNDQLLKVEVARGNHSAVVADLSPDDRSAVLDRIEQWTGTRPAFGGSGLERLDAQRTPPQLLNRGMTRTRY